MHNAKEHHSPVHPQPFGGLQCQKAAMQRVSSGWFILCLAIGFVLALMASCGPALVGEGEPCSAQSTCMSGLICTAGLCQKQAATEHTHQEPTSDANVESPDIDGGSVPRKEPQPEEPGTPDAKEERVGESRSEASTESIPESIPEPQPEPSAPDSVPDAPPTEPGDSRLSIRLQAVRVSHDDGSLQASILPAEVTQWVTETNKVFQAANVSIQFDPKQDFADVKNTLLNRIEGKQFPDWAQAVAEGNKIATKYPGKFVVFFRYGRGSNPTGGGFSWTDYDFFVMPGFNKTYVCGHQNITLFAHEFGHFLGLRHTFHNTYKTNADAQAAWDIAKNPAVFDGDGLADTHPDAFTEQLQCTNATQMTLSGTTLPIPRDNIMSYHDSKTKTLTPQQSAIVRQVAVLRNKQDIKRLVPGATLHLEGEALKVVSASKGSATSQNMRGFHGRWSQDAQLWWAGDAPPGKLEVSFSLSAPGKYKVYAILTKASDFGVYMLQLNGTNTISVDLYGKHVFHTQPIDLGVHTLQASNTLIFAAQGKHTASRGYGLGIDALIFKPSL